MATPANIRKAQETERKRNLGLVQKTYWLTNENVQSINEYRLSNNLKTNNEAINAMICFHADFLKKEKDK